MKQIEPNSIAASVVYVKDNTGAFIPYARMGTKDGAGYGFERGLGGGERNPDSVDDGYQVVREECTATIVDVQTTITIGGGNAGDTHLMGIFISKILTGTCVIGGFRGSSDVAGSITIDAGAPIGLLNLKAAVNDIGPLTITCSNVADANNVTALWKPI